MSMLQSFFEIGKDKTLFDGLRISDNQELCEKYQGKFPVVSVSLKGINGATYEEARRFLIKTINEEARRLSVLSDSTELDETDHELLTQLKKKEMTNDSLVYSIRELTELLEKHYDRKVIVLIDEYDVPLAKANENGYYDEMVLLIRNLFENALKTNSSLKFAVLTGCLRIAKESIFTGLNNFKVYSITDKSFDETFGFTVLEALSFGVPVIVSDHVGAKDIVGKAGIIIKAGNIDDLESTLEKLINSPETLSDLKAEAEKNKIKTWEQFVDENYQLYRKLIK